MPDVADFMNKQVVRVPATATAHEAAQVMTEKGVGCLIIEENGRPVGIITERDFLRKITAPDMDPAKIKVAEIMSKPLITIRPEATLREAARKMRENNIRRLIVTKNSDLVGIITVRDIAGSIMATMARQAE
ncbi:MAG: cyclic nucleotide-binding/CBS domain-containing protein [Candidatus Bathyarchaeia archaeon]